jgi:hypothetical protein
LLPWKFLKRFLKVRGVEKHFTAAALHPYAPTVAKFKRLLKRTRSALKKGGAKKKDMWLTEVGWGSRKGKFSLTKGTRGQARMLRKSFRFVVRKRPQAERRARLLVLLARPQATGRSPSVHLLHLGRALERQARREAFLSEVQALRSHAALAIGDRITATGATSRLRC